MRAPPQQFVPNSSNLLLLADDIQVGIDESSFSMRIAHR